MGQERNTEKEVLGPEDFQRAKETKSIEEWGYCGVENSSGKTEEKKSVEEWGYSETEYTPDKTKSEKKKPNRKLVIIATVVIALLLSVVGTAYALKKAKADPSEQLTNTVANEVTVRVNGVVEKINYVEVPECVGLKLEEAEPLINKVFNEEPVIVYENSDKPEGIVIYQSIESGKSVPDISVLTLFVSKGTETVAQNKSEEATVKTIPLKKVNLSLSKTTLVPGESSYIATSIEPANATNANFFLTLSNESVAVLSGENVLTAIAVGNTSVIAMNSKGEELGSVQITVKAPETQALATKKQPDANAANNGKSETEPHAPATEYSAPITEYVSPTTVQKTAAPIAETYLVSFNANGGTISQASKTVTKGGTYGTLPSPARSGFTFDGWYTSGGAKVNSSSAIAYNRDHELIARWVSEWVLSSQAPDNAEIIDTKTEYRYKTKEYTYSSETSLSGYERTGEERWVPQNNTVVVKRVDSWPAGTSKTKGFCTDSSLYKTYNKALPQNTETTRYVLASKTTAGYLYWHWCYTHDIGKVVDCYVSDTKGESGGNLGEGHTANNFHAFFSESKISYNSKANAFKYNDKNKCPYTYWWLSNGKNHLTVYTYTYNVEKKEYRYAKWGDYSAWSSEYVSANDSRKVETRTWVKYRV